jgi:glycosyltransferase involved in cell wall biosynthesis
VSPSEPLVSIGLPVRNGGATLIPVVESILAQQHGNLELIISDNASTDDTEDVCRALARTDPRIRYHRQPENIGLLNNFLATLRESSGEYFRWIGDSDWLAPGYLTRCLSSFAADDRLILVTTQIEYELDDGSLVTSEYHGTGLSSDDPVERFREMLRLLTVSYSVIDPVYGLYRRAPLVAIPRPNMMREDEIFAARCALAGPWAHLNEVLAGRCWSIGPRTQLARRLGVSPWQARLDTEHECRELVRCLRSLDLDPEARRQCMTAVARFYLLRKRHYVARGRRKLVRMARQLAPGSARVTT